MNIAEQFGDRFKIEADPFSAGTISPHLGRPLQSAFREIVRHIVLKTPIVLVTGEAGTGKTLLVDMTARVCNEMGLPVHRIDRGDLVHITLGEQADVLLIDEANSIPDTMLNAVLPGGGKNTAATTVFLGLPSCTTRFMLADARPVLIELTSLSPVDARNYLTDQAASAGLRDLFSDEALELIVVGTHGSPRALRSIASLAFFFAASAGASQISVEHATSALIGRVPPPAQKADEAIVPPQRAEDDGLPPENIDDGVLPPLTLDAPLAEDAATDQIPFRFAAEQPAESIFPAFHNEEPVASQSATRAPLEAQKLPDDIWSRRAEADSGVAIKEPGLLKFRPKTAVAAIVVVILVVAAIAMLTPSMQAGTNLPSPPQATTPTAAVQPPEPAVPALPSDLGSAPAKNAQAAPVSDERDNSARGEKPTNTAIETVAKPSAEAPQQKTVSRRTLSPEEEAAVARGIQELQQSARRVETGRR